MAIITDGTHLVSTVSEAELHEFADRLGLKRAWFQAKNPHHLHYDLTTKRKAARAIELGAMRVTSLQLLKQAWWASTNPVLVKHQEEKMT